MRRTSIPILLSAVLLLAACSGDDDAKYTDAAQPSAEDNAVAAAIDNSVAQNGAAATALTGAPVVPPTPGIARRHILPVGFQGYWGRLPRDCELANVGATGRLSVEEDVLRFYESRAKVSAMRVRSPSEVEADLAFEGEGEKWTRRASLVLSAGGTRLTRREDGAAAVEYVRC